MIPFEFSLLADIPESGAAFPEAASTFASANDSLYWMITWVCILFFVPIAGCLFYFALRYRKPKGAKAESSATHNTPLELAWSILPSFFLIAMFVMGAQAYLDHRTIPDGANEVNVLAMKWKWSVDYGGGTIHPELHILVDEPTKLTMRSSDVIHSLYVPAFRAKKDVVPGRFNYMWFKPTVASSKVSPEEVAAAKEWQESEEGVAWTKENNGEAWNFDKWQFTPEGYTFYDLYCAEYCGRDHSIMQTVVVVHETLEDLQAWIKLKSARGDGVDPAEYGKTLYQNRGCAGCHSDDGSKRVGPSFLDLYGASHGLTDGTQIVVDENYVRESIIYPKAKIAAGYQPVMPSFQGQLSDDDLYCIVEYLKSISSNTPKPKPAAEEESAETESTEAESAAAEEESPAEETPESAEDSAAPVEVTETSEAESAKESPAAEEEEVTDAETESDSAAEEGEPAEEGSTEGGDDSGSAPSEEPVEEESTAGDESESPESDAESLESDPAGDEESDE